MDNFTVNTVETDYRAELVAAGLIENGCLSEKTHIVRRSMPEIAKDVDKIKKEYTDVGVDVDEYLCIYANRSGIYDVLPEGVFHQSASAKKQQGRDAIIGEIAKQRKEEFFARKYFQPFEMALDKALVDARIYEQRYNKPHLYGYLSRIFDEQWEILKHLSVVQSLLFLRLVPIMTEAPGSLELTAKVIGILLNCPVSIRESKKSKHAMTSKKSVSLGNWKLGINSVTGKTVSGDNMDLEISIGPVTPQEMKLFEYNANRDLILRCLIDMLFPFDRSIKVKYVVTETEKKFRLSGQGHKTYLGINTTL